MAVRAIRAEARRSQDRGICSRSPVVPLAEEALRDVLGSLSGNGIFGNEMAFSPDSTRFVCGSQVWHLTESGPQPHGKPLA